MPARKDILAIILTLIIFIMGIEIVILAIQNRRLRAVLAETTQYQPLQANQQLPALAGSDLNGNPVDIRYGPDAPATLLIWLSPSCHICQENVPFWKRLHAERQSSKFRYLVLCAGTIDEARAYAAQHQLTFPVVSMTDDRLVSAYNGYVLPQTALISPTGSIVNVWPGALDANQQNDVITFLDKL